MVRMRSHTVHKSAESPSFRTPRGDLFFDEHGFTTVSMVLALLITLSLIFAAAQVYRVGSVSAEVQNVADAAALSAESQVAEFVLVVRLCDAVSLTLSLTGLTLMGLGIVALCTPATAPVSEKLIDAGTKALRARDKFVDRASEALNKIQRALPFFAAACAANVAHANDGDSTGSHYLGVALLVPEDAEDVRGTSDESADKVTQDVSDQADDIRKAAKEADEVAKEANEAKLRAFMHDCGNDPNYCMYERASTLASLPPSENPRYSSVDTWTFSVALDRARAYYAARAAIEAPADGSVEEQARSALRARFYAYAIRQLDGAYVHETEDTFEAHFPHFPRNTDQMRETELYTEAVYPVSLGENGSFVMHAYNGCPGIDAIVGSGSIQQMEQEPYDECPFCGFKASSLGSVAAASSNIENGFEYHYEQVALEAENYQKAREKGAPASKEVKRRVDDLLDELENALQDSAAMRFDPKPPGRFGAVALVVNVGSVPASTGFASMFVDDAGTLGARAAISGATLLDEESTDGQTAITSLLDGLREDGGAAVGAGGIALNCWSTLLSSYESGQMALEDAIESGLNSLPLVGPSGLGTWAAGKLRDTVAAAGLQPANIKALKPVLVNSAHVLAASDGQFASGLTAVKQQAISHPLMSTDLFASATTEAERAALEAWDDVGDSVEIASIELFGEGGPSIPITIPLPDEVKTMGARTLEDLFDTVRSTYFDATGARPWE